MSVHASLHAPGDPGKQNIYVEFATPAKALDCTVDVLIFLYDKYLKISPKPSIFLSSNTSTASGVPSLPVTPVPPVVITTLIDFVSIHLEIILLIEYILSLVIKCSTT